MKIKKNKECNNTFLLLKNARIESIGIHSVKIFSQDLGLNIKLKPFENGCILKKEAF